MKKTILFLALLLLASDLMAQDAPSGWTPNYRFRKYGTGKNPGADRLNANWTGIDLAIFKLDTAKQRLDTTVIYEADSTKLPGYVTRFMFAADSNYARLLNASALRDTAAQLRASIGSGGGSMTKQQIIDSLNASIPDTTALTKSLTVNQWVGFNGSNSGTATVGTGDSVQVSVSGLTSNALIVASYRSNTPLTSSNRPVAVGNVQTGKFTIFADSGEVVNYWIMTGNFTGVHMRTLFHGNGPYVMGDSVGFAYTPISTDSLLIFQGLFQATIAPDSGGFVGVLFGLQDGDDTDDSLESVLFYNDTGSPKVIDTTIQISFWNDGSSGTLVFKPFRGYTASSDTITDMYFYALDVDTTFTQPDDPTAEMAWNGVGSPTWTMSHTVKEIWGSGATFTQSSGAFASGMWTKVDDDTAVVIRGTATWSATGEDATLSTTFYVPEEAGNNQLNVGVASEIGPATGTNEYFVKALWLGTDPYYLVTDTVYGPFEMNIATSGAATMSIIAPRIEVARPTQKKQFIYTKAASDSILVATFHIHGTSDFVAPGGSWDANPYFKGLGGIMRLGGYLTSICLVYDQSVAFGIDSMLQLRIPLDTMTIGRTDTVRLKFFAYDSLDVLQVTLPYVTIIKKVSDLLLNPEQLPEQFKNPLWRKGDFV